MQPLVMLMATGLMAASTGCYEEQVTSQAGAIEVAKAPTVVLAQSPRDVRVEVALQMIGGGRFDQAQLAMETVLAERPEYARAEFLLGLSKHKQKLYQQALPHYQASLDILQEFPERVHVHHFRGWAHYYLGQMTQSRKEFNAHLALVPEEADSMFGLALTYMDEGDHDRAEPMFLEAIRLQEGMPGRVRELAKAHARLGDLRLQQSRNEQAILEYERAVELYPAHHEVWSKLARVYDRVGRVQDAEEARKRHAVSAARAGRVRETGETESTQDVQIEGGGDEERQ